MLATHYNPNPEVVKSILLAADNYDLEDNDGLTALMHSACNKNNNPEIFLAIYKFLQILDPRKMKSRLMKRANNGKDMLDLAIDADNVAIAEEIEKAMKVYENL